MRITTMLISKKNISNFQVQSLIRSIFFAIILCLSPFSLASVVDFESLSDSEIVTTQFTGLTFLNAIALSSDISLNQFEFPPHSGFNVISDNEGAITIDFSVPVTNVNGYFTYGASLVLDGFDSLNNLVVTSNSLFANNTALSGDVGSNSNELISLTYANGLSRIIISGDINGASFVLDDLSYSTISAVPLPASIVLFISGLASFFLKKRQRKSI